MSAIANTRRAQMGRVLSLLSQMVHGSRRSHEEGYGRNQFLLAEGLGNHGGLGESLR